MQVPSKPSLLASIHDVSPRFERQVDVLIAELQPWVGMRFSMLVVPNHWGTAPIRRGSAFASRLRAWSDAGVELLLHGLYHRDDQEHSGFDRLRGSVMTAGEGEFLGLTVSEASRRIAYGRNLLSDITGREINGFVAPAWLYGRGARAALTESGMTIAEDHWRVWSPQSGTVLARGPVITWASRTATRRASSLLAAAVLRNFAPQPVLRVAVHPGDSGSPALLASIRRTLKAASDSRKPVLYSDLTT
jgi:predicted deacetylase